MFKKIWNIISRPRIRYDPLVKVYIFRSALRDNYNAFATAFAGVKIAPVLKSNAYGHGLAEVARALDELRPPFFVVDSFFEALILRRASVKSPILVIGYSRPEVISGKTLRGVAFAISDIQTLRDVARALRRPQAIHLKIDTGMNRQGIKPSEIAEALAILKGNGNLIVEGVCSHLGDAENADQSFTEAQIEVWNKSAEKLEKALPHARYFHLAATKGFGGTPKIKANAARIGIGIYGINPNPRYRVSLRPALELRSILSAVKRVGKGEKIGYNATFEASREMLIGSVPAGYNEGVDRRLSNSGSVLVRGVVCPIIGRVSMNITTIDVTDLPEARQGEEVVLLSADPDSPNSVEKTAAICHTIPYEILIHIPGYLRREVV
ncbi:MAG: Alanine racemase [Parcubacteria group bacterium GW2011_GWA2_52_8]|nr:MAG: Alanine racemase [Parcubacteria group bacterium GW2011_GWA2_52_8]